MSHAHSTTKRRTFKWRSTLLGRGVMGWYNGVDSKGKLCPNSSGYFTADLDLRYEPQTDLGVFLRINNIFNKDYQDKLHHPAEGASFLLGVDMTFYAQNEPAIGTPLSAHYVRHFPRFDGGS